MYEQEVRVVKDHSRLFGATREAESGEEEPGVWGTMSKGPFTCSVHSRGPSEEQGVNATRT